MSNTGGAAMDTQEILDWFDRDELEPCPRCGERIGLPIRTAGTFICFGCGYIRWRGGETSVAELQGRGATTGS